MFFVSSNSPIKPKVAYCIILYNQKDIKDGKNSILGKNGIKMVAGAGFEPATSRL